MRNKNIRPNQIVPKNIRRKVYQETYSKFLLGELENTSMHPNGLCRILPQILWGITLYDEAPNGESWTVHSATEMFPELQTELSKIQEIYFSPEQRLEFLEKHSKK